MPRASSVEPCLICGKLPCECFTKKAKPPAKPRVAKPKPALADAEPMPAEVPAKPTPSQAEVIKERMRARAAAAPAIPPPPIKEERVRARPTAASAELPPLSDDGLAALHAIRLLDDAFGVDGPEIEKFRPYLDKPATTRERSAHWKLRRRSEGETNED